MESTAAETSPSGGATLPYSISGAERTYQPSEIEIRNRSGTDVALSLSIRHCEVEFFDREYELSDGEDVGVDGVTATAGKYTVEAEVSDGGHTAYDWRIPPAHGWPRLVVRIEDGSKPVVGCGSGEAVGVDVRGTGGEVTLELFRSGRRVRRRTAEPGESVALSVPIGDFYTLVATTPEGSDRTEVAACYCYEQRETTVTVGEDGPVVESRTGVCM